MNFKDFAQNAQGAGKDRNVDVVFCIDGTGSMHGVINNLKEHAKRFKEELVEGLVEARTNVTSIRVRVIVFRDYGCDSEPMTCSEFFTLPADQAEFEATLNAIEAYGGGDEPENGFEALYYAMNSKWVTGQNDRQIIVLFTDTDALDLKERADSVNYPAEMVDAAGLDNLWAGGQSQTCLLRDRCKRLIIFAPAGTKYSELIWNRTQFCPVEPNGGLKEIDFSEIIKNIVKSATAV